MSKSGETLTNSYFANASGKEFVELDNEITFIENGDIVNPQRHLSSHTGTTTKPTTTTTAKTTTNPKTTAKPPPRVSTDGTVAAGKMKGVTKLPCADGKAGCFRDKNGNEYMGDCASIKDTKLGKTP